MKIKELPALERPYEKFMFLGADALSDAELLAIIIKSGTKDKTAVQLIQDLMIKYDYEEEGLGFMHHLSLEEIQSLNGIGNCKAVQLKAVCELARRMAKPSNLRKYKISSPEDAASIIMEDLRYRKQEVFQIILLDNQNGVMKVVTVTIGGLNRNMIDVREIFKEPIKCSASKIILAHNHPSGNPCPSESDVIFTKRCFEAGNMLGIDVLDHIIIGNGIFSSLKKMGKF